MSARPGASVTSTSEMDPDEEKPDSSGDETDESGGATPWLPPDDRLWRHPSEVRAHPGNVAGRESWLGRLSHGANAPLWFVGAVSGIAGALLSAGILIATGVVGAQAPVLPLTTSIVPSTAPEAGQGSANLTAILEMVEPSIVSLSVNGPQGVALGSGVIVSTDGAECYVLTDSALFFEGGANAQVQVTSDWGDVAVGYLVGTDPSSGIAVVRVALTPTSAVSTANLGTVANMQTGEEVLSVGSLVAAGSSNESSFALGYINDTSSYLQPVNGASNGMFSMMVADMAIGSSDYGGALVDSSGAVLGITNPVSTQLGQVALTYVTPIDIAMADVSSMLKTKQPAPHPWLGILQATDVSGPLAKQLGVAGAVQVDGVAVGSPAARAGISDNDVVTAVGGQTVASVGALIAWMASARPGQMVVVDWLSAGRRRQADITLGTQPASANAT